MIVRLFSAGKSFKGLGTYLTHDVKADTAERVAWTHTLNCANDHVPSAIHEMVNTYLDAELLKEEAGIRRGGRPLEDAVKHFSLSWHPEETPSREQMIAAIEGYLGHMGWAEHQAVLACHTDKPHAHVHAMLNAVHPETGRKLDDGLEWRRSQEWALAYEREHGRIYCEQRLEPVEKREPAPTRAAWTIMQEAERAQAQVDAARLDAEEARAAADAPSTEAQAWKELRDQQRQQREDFFGIDSRKAHRTLGREVARLAREEFREDWTEFYELQHLDPGFAGIPEMRHRLTQAQETWQKQLWEERRLRLREAREADYDVLLDAQKAERVELTGRLARGDEPDHDVGMTALDDPGPFVARGIGADSPAWEFRGAANETTRPPAPMAEPTDNESCSRTGNFEPAALRSGVRPATDVVAGLGLGAIGGLATLTERLLDGFLGGPSSSEATGSIVVANQNDPRPNPFAAVADEARRAAEREEAERRRKSGGTSAGKPVPETDEGSAPRGTPGSRSPRARRRIRVRGRHATGAIGVRLAAARSREAEIMLRFAVRIAGLETSVTAAAREPAREALVRERDACLAAARALTAAERRAAE